MRVKQPAALRDYKRICRTAKANHSLRRVIAAKLATMSPGGEVFRDLPMPEPLTNWRQQVTIKATEQGAWVVMRFGRSGVESEITLRARWKRKGRTTDDLSLS
jgi:hypothetical protein